MYIRYHVKYYSPKTLQPVGLFVAVWHLVQNGVLTKDEIDEYWRNRKYSEEVLPIPPFYSDGNSIGAVTWFKENEKTKKILLKLKFYFVILRKYHVILEISRNDDPGEIIYEDDYQIGVISNHNKL